VLYPHVLHRRCWVHKVRNIVEKVRQRDCEAVKEAGAIYRAPNLAAAGGAFHQFHAHSGRTQDGLAIRGRLEFPDSIVTTHTRHTRRKIRRRKRTQSSSHPAARSTNFHRKSQYAPGLSTRP
jgi:hypothetical protein